MIQSQPSIAQTNQMQSGSTQTNVQAGPIYSPPAPIDFQRLQYYYAAYPSSPAPGTEQGVFTLNPDRTWSGTWNSSTVPAPTRSQLNAITAQQVDVFQLAGVFTNGVWQIVTSTTNIPLSSLNLTASSYAQIRTTAVHDQMLRQCHQLEQVYGAASP
jgi:hypothetical protein